MADPRAGCGDGAGALSEVDPNSAEARRRREALGRVGEHERAARDAATPYAIAAALAALMLAALFVVRPDWARSYAWLVAGLALLPFLHTLFVGAATGGWLVPRPFGLRPVATVLVASGLFMAVVIAAPELASDIGPSLAGVLVGIVLASAVLGWVVLRLLDT